MLAVERYERPPGYEGFTASTRRAASRAQFLSFARAYWWDWRHTKIRLYRQLLEQRASIVEREGRRWAKATLDPESLVFYQVTNGILAAAASEFCQYAEDLALLARACNSDDYFARELTQARAGKMQAAVKAWPEIDEQGVADLLRFPLISDSEWRKSAIGVSYEEALDRAVTRLRYVGRLYTDWEFHFMRYKHGLLLALAEGAPVREELIERRKTTLTGQASAFDCGAEWDPAGRGDPVFALPDVSDESIHVRLNAAHLAAEGNLLRMIPPAPLEPSIEIFEQAAAIVSQLQRVVLRNRVQEIQGPEADTFCMPGNDPAELIGFRSGAPEQQEDEATAGSERR